jgi:putative ABC transport system permease protein
MILVALRGLLTRKLRTVLTMIAILLGVSMISGTFVLTDTIDTSFTNIFQQAGQGTDVVITGTVAVKGQFDNKPPALPASLLSIVRGTPGVKSAEGAISDTAGIYTLRGKAVGATGGAPGLLFSWAHRPFNPLTIIQGHAPLSHGQFVVDKSTFDKQHLHLGQRLLIGTGTAAAKPFTLVGNVRFGTVTSIGGAAIIVVPLADAQVLTGKVGKFDQISVAAQSGLSQTELAQRIQQRIPTSLRSTVKVATENKNVSDQAGAIAQALNFITIALLAFGGIAVFVGAFIIFNTFSITVAQRIREFAMLRTLGATRAQVLRSVLLEALLVGLVASIIGLLAGLGIARGLTALFVAFNIDLPSTGLVFQARTAVVGLLTGTIVTLVAGLVPAIRATNVPPIAALREGAVLPRSRFARFVPIAAVVGLGGGIGLLLFGVFGSFSATGTRLTVIGLGALLLFIGVAMIAPHFVKPAALLLGWPVERVTRITGRLARENTARNPTRTAVTAAALMIGLTLVGFVTVFADELRTSATAAIKRELAGDFLIYNDQGSTIPDAIGPAISRLPGVGVVSPILTSRARVAGMGVTGVNGIDPATITRVYNFDWQHGSTASATGLGSHGILVTDSFAKDHHVAIGQRLRLTSPAGVHDTFTVRGIYQKSQLLTGVTIPAATMRRNFQLKADEAIIANADPGANKEQVRKRLTAFLQHTFPTAAVHSEVDFENQQTTSVNQLLALVYVLLAMSVIVSLFGIINTLVLSIYERTREIGMLRAIGTTRTQVRWIVRWESVITSIIGGVLGLILGVALAFLITTALQSQGLSFSLPGAQLLIWVIFAILFGIIAAAWPARRAARLDVLQAIAYE